MMHVIWSLDDVVLGEAWLIMSEYRSFLDYIRKEGWDFTVRFEATYDHRAELDYDKVPLAIQGI